MPELLCAICTKRFARRKSSYPRRRSSSPWGGISDGQSLLGPPSNTRYSATPNAKSTVSPSKKSISFTPNRTQFCEAPALTGSHPGGFRYLVNVIPSVMPCSLHGALIVRTDASFTWRIHGQQAVSLKYQFSRRDTAFPNLGDRTQTRGRSESSTLLGRDRFGTGDWR